MIFLESRDFMVLIMCWALDDISLMLSVMWPHPSSQLSISRSVPTSPKTTTHFPMNVSQSPAS